MWDELRAELETELENIERLQTDYADLLEAVENRDPDKVEILALAGLLHSFYGGVENALSRIDKEFGSSKKASSSWHSDLLRGAATKNELRPPIIDESLEERLRLLLGFRHVARANYSFNLRWDRMQELVSMLPKVAADFGAQIRVFLGWLGEGHLRGLTP